MSTTHYEYKPNIIKVVTYTYWDRTGWHSREHTCYAQTDEEAIASCYRHTILTYKQEFHITSIVTKTV